ncbi:hypothetical protein AA0117_g6367 [Alternaria alternata]|uniref:Extracellular membrane protein CFEM domain-containing protein n=2 Tax=Alternaria alternata complex TaxID=187734 RepID=A0A4Q4NH63_ALTAL|nr:hypothetical protein AA0115_g11748 [Alternaria tenuissima]RYN75505.1 hypothetical protein AA0117_g6367 [Alternaria alternata]
MKLTTVLQLSFLGFFTLASAESWDRCFCHVRGVQNSCATTKACAAFNNRAFDGKDCVAEPYNQKIRGPEFHNTCLQFLGGADSCCTRVERVGGPTFRSDGCKGT